MPSQILHCLAGEYALGNAFVDIPEHQHFRVLFNLGCQGPDIFAHNRRTRPLALTYARLLHRGGYGRFCRHIASQIVGRPWSAVAFWFAGFITHQILDRTLHPYIVYRSPLQSCSGDQPVRPASWHAFLERILDAAMLQHLKNLPVAAFDTEAALVLPEAIPGALETAIAAALRRAYPDPAAEDEALCARIHNAFIDSAYFYTVTNPARNAFACAPQESLIERFLASGLNAVALLYPENISGSEDYLNLEKRSWRDPGSGEQFNDSVPELFARSVAEAARGIALVGHLVSGTAEIQEAETFAGNSCLSSAGADGKIAIPVYREPFNLESVLGDQAEQRRLWLENRSGLPC